MGNVKATRIVILAAGKGTRMKNDQLPKVLAPLKERPIIDYLLAAVRESQIDPRPVIVVGYHQEQVKDALGYQYDYVVQSEQKGTGHAVLATRRLLEGKADNILVLYGDHPFVQADTIRRLVREHEINNSVLTMMIVEAGDFKGWHKALLHYGRLVKNEQGRIIKNVEYKDADDKLRQTTLVNPCFYCFNADWLWEHLPLLDNKNVQNEYYLTDLIEMAVNEDKRIFTVNISPIESIGINSVEELNEAEGLVKS